MADIELSYLARFAAAEREVSQRPAVVESGRVVSYSEFGSLVRRLAFALVHAQTGSRVLIHLPQSSEAFATMFAVGVSGGFYATTNVAAPPERRRGTFEAFGPDIIVTNADLADEARAICPSARLITVASLGKDELTVPAEPHELAYVMFTSGTTGQPKGVMISKAALSHYVDWVMNAMDVRANDRWSQHANIAFDLSVLDIYGALCAGAALVPITGADLLMPAAAIRRHQLTIWNSVPSVLTSMIKIKQATEKNFQTLRMLTFCGEPLQRLHVESIFAARPDVIVHNTYGPTEATVSCTLLRLDSGNYEEACQSTVAIGDPIPGIGIDLVDGPDDSCGEIVITGPQLAAGYWNDPDATAAKFRRFQKDGAEKFGYFTGDWAHRAGKHVFFRSRIDTQVKIRGERVELDDIAAALMRCGRGFACALFIGDELHGVFESEATVMGDEALHAAIARYLPLHLIPSRFHALRELPRSPNGKVDLGTIRSWIKALPHDDIDDGAPSNRANARGSG